MKCIKVSMYKRWMCKHYKRGYCKYGKNCKFAHGLDELRKPVQHPTQKSKSMTISKHTDCVEDDFVWVQ